MPMNNNILFTKLLLIVYVVIFLKGSYDDFKFSFLFGVLQADCT